MKGIFSNWCGNKPICFSNLKNDLNSFDAFKTKWETTEKIYGDHVLSGMKMGNNSDIAYFIQLLLYHKKYDIAYYFADKVKKYRKNSFKNIIYCFLDGMNRHIDIEPKYDIPVETSQFLAHILKLNGDDVITMRIYNYLDRRYNNTTIPIEIGRKFEFIRNMNLRSLWESVLIKNNNRGDLSQFDDYIIAKILEFI